jgi:hypothetical protein
MKGINILKNLCKSNKKLILFLFLIHFPLFAQDKFTPGEGAVYDFRLKDAPPSKLSIYITESSFNKLGVEYFFDASNQLFGKSMYQQYALRMTPQMTLTEGYIQTDTMSKPEIMTEEFMRVNSGVQVEDFLFQKESQLEPYKVGVETVEVPAGSVKAIHYRKKRNGQIVDFWIADDAKPIGLIKLTSTGKKNHQNYTIELINLAQGIKPKIEPKKAIPLTSEGKSLLKTQID